MNSISWIRTPQTRLPKTKCNFKINKRKNLSSDQVKSRTAKLKYSRVKKTSPKRKSHINSWNMSFLCKKYFSKKKSGKNWATARKKIQTFFKSEKIRIFFWQFRKIRNFFFCIFLTYFLVLVTRQISMQNPESAQKNFKKISN